ncbi:MAG TPA: DNRLRE domain-containing protein, partial [Actinomycetales bacterium]|nr:DNRLRE domain-containing protein [Actinomycetales bacterium]
MADTYVDDASPTTSFGQSATLRADAKSVKRSFLLFHVQGVGGRDVLDVELRLHSVSESPFGGRIFRISSTDWTESMTWQTQPPIDGPQVAQVGAVQTEKDYDVVLNQLPVADGLVALAIDSINTTEARWSSRKAADPPVLSVDTPHVPGAVGDGLSAVSTMLNGSSDPTYLSMNKHVAVTQQGRVLVVHGRHKEGVVLAWRDPGGGWQNRTTGAVTDGELLSGTGTGGWPASVVTGRDGAGAEHAWAVWASPNTGSTENDLRPLAMRRLSELDSPSGPVVGPAVAVGPGGIGNHRADLAIEHTPGGGQRVAVTWERSRPEGGYELVVSWISDLDSDTPAVSGPYPIATGTGPGLMGTVVGTGTGLSLVGRLATGRLGVLHHDAGDPLDQWSSSSAGMPLASTSYPSAVWLSSTSDVVAAVEDDVVNGVVSVQRFTAAGVARPAEATFTGYRDPTIVTDGARLWVVMVRASDGYVVSRRFTPTGGWAASDRVEIGAEGGGNYAWPNAYRDTDDRLRLVVRGPAGSAFQSQVLYFQRPLSTASDPEPPPAADVTVEGSVVVSSGSTQQSSTSVVLDAPVGVRDGDVLYAWVSLRSAVPGGLVAPAGWSLVAHPVESSGEAYLYRAVYGTDVTGATWT